MNSALSKRLKTVAAAVIVVTEVPPPSKGRKQVLLAFAKKRHYFLRAITWQTGCRLYFVLFQAMNSKGALWYSEETGVGLTKRPLRSSSSSPREAGSGVKCSSVKMDISPPQQHRPLFVLEKLMVVSSCLLRTTLVDQTDISIKFNYSSGEPAPEKITDKIYGYTQTVELLKMADMPDVDLTTCGAHKFGDLVEVIDPVSDYLNLAEKVFDFDLIKSLRLRRSDFKIGLDVDGAITGAYENLYLLMPWSRPIVLRE